MQFAKQATKIFVLVSIEYLIPEDENMMLEECVLDCCKLGRIERCKAHLADFCTNGRCYWLDIHMP